MDQNGARGEATGRREPSSIRAPHERATLRGKEGKEKKEANAAANVSQHRGLRCSLRSRASTTTTTMTPTTTTTTTTMTTTRARARARATRTRGAHAYISGVRARDVQSALHGYVGIQEQPRVRDAFNLNSRHRHVSYPGRLVLLPRFPTSMSAVRIRAVIPRRWSR